MSNASIISSSLPISRGSIADSELFHLIREYPKESKAFLNKHFSPRGIAEEHSHANNGQHAQRARFNGQTHYQEEYVPRHVFRPPLVKTDGSVPKAFRQPMVPMDTMTSHQFDYRPLDVSGWSPPRGKEGESTRIYDSNAVDAIDIKTSYQADYHAREIMPERSFPIIRSNRNKFPLDAKIQGETVTKSSFKSPWVWKDGKQKVDADQPLRFGELPTFTESILFGQKPVPVASTSQACYRDPASQGKVEQAVKIKAAEGNIRLEGEIDLLTTQRASYPAGRHIDWNEVRPALHNSNATTDKEVHRIRQKLMDETQFKSDFPTHDRYERIPPSKPHSNDLNIFKGNNSIASAAAVESETISSFPGYDVRKYPMPKSYKRDTDTYVPPTETFSTETVTRVDYRPLPLSPTTMVQKNVSKSHLHSNLELPFAKSIDTVSKSSYKDWSHQLKPRIRHGDLQEVINYQPPHAQFIGQSETKASFKPNHSIELTRSFVPEEHAMEVDGKIDFNTEYRKSFKSNQHRYHLSKAQAEELKKELLRLKVSRNRS